MTTGGNGHDRRSRARRRARRFRGRAVYEPLARELARQQENVEALRAGRVSAEGLEALDTSALDWAAHVMQERTDESRAVAE